MTIADFITANGSNIQVLGDDYAFASMIMRLDSILDTQQPHNRKLYTCQGYALAMSQRISPPPQAGVPGATVAFTGDYGNYISKHQYC